VELVCDAKVDIPRNLLDQGLGSEESIVLLCELLDELLVLNCQRHFVSKLHNTTYLVELLQILNGHEGELLVELLSSVDIHSIGENAEGHSRSGNVGQSDGSRESLVPLGVVVLETDLEFDGLDEVPLLSTGLLVGLQGGLG
jgi:hypothetical protein